MKQVAGIRIAGSAPHRLPTLKELCEAVATRVTDFSEDWWGTRPTHIWLHTAMRSWVDEIELATGLIVIIDHEKLASNHFDVGIGEQNVDKSKWEGRVANNPGKEGVLNAIAYACQRFRVKKELEPTHVSLGEAYAGEGDWVFEQTGLELATPGVGPTASSPLHVYVGRPDGGAAEVESSFIKSVEYDHHGGDEGDLVVEFKNKDGSVVQCIYYQVPPQIHEEMMAAESTGTFYHRNIKGKYDWATLGE